MPSQLIDIGASLQLARAEKWNEQNARPQVGAERDPGPNRLQACLLSRSVPAPETAPVQEMRGDGRDLHSRALRRLLERSQPRRPELPSRRPSDILPESDRGVNE